MTTTERKMIGMARGIATRLAKKYGCRADVGVECNNVGRVTWSVGFDSNGQMCEAGSLTEAIEQAAFGQETTVQKAKRLRKEAAADIAEADRLELRSKN